MTRSSRRGFFRHLGSAAAVSSIAEFRSLLAAAPEGEAYWTTVRRQFAFDEERVPMNAANLCPSPKVVADRLVEVTRDIDRDCSSQNRAKFTKLLEETRGKVAAQLGVSPGEIALVRNTSEANNTINNGFPLKTGDEVIVWDQNHPTNLVAWDVRAARYGIAVRRVGTPPDPSGPEELLNAFERAFTPRTRLLAITHVSNTTGVRLPVRELCRLAHRRGVFVHLDGAQTWGALHVNLRELDCDSYSASAHKWFVGPREAGLLYVRQDRIAGIWPNTVAPGWGDDADTDLPGARKFESLGQRDDACLAAVGAAADFHQALGPERVEARVLALARSLKERLQEAGARLLTPLRPDLSGGVCVVAMRLEDAKRAADRLYREFGIAGAASGGLRLCPHIYNTHEHVARAVSGVARLARFG